MRSVEEQIARRHRKVGAAVLVAGVAVLVWASARARTVAAPDRALATLHAALKSGDAAALGQAREQLAAAARRQPLAIRGMQRLAALDLMLSLRPACTAAGARPAARTTSLACHILHGDYAAAVAAAGREPVGPQGHDALLASLAGELLARTEGHAR